MSGRGRRKNRCKPIVSEDFRISTDEIIRNFLQDMSVQKYTFPSNLTNVQRAYVHELARKFGLKSRSTGKEPNRCLNIMKINKLVTIDDFGLDFAPETVQQVRKLLNSFPLSQREIHIVESYSPKNKDNTGNSDRSPPDDNPVTCKTLVRLHDGKPIIPPPPATTAFEKSRKELPIAEYKQFIINSINDNQVILISGETGCGKTTQLPQFILEDAYRHGKECRVFCTQPRRLSAVSVAERVATERGEPIGQSIGYQIRLESRVSPRTVLTYCTNGVLLRSLMTGMSCLDTLTHVIVDEVHERDRFSDFLLICLREILKHNKSLKLILMSATADTVGFQNYFNNLPIIHVPGRQYPVSEYYLEDILRTLNYATPAMKKFDKENSGKLKSIVQNTGVAKSTSVVNQRQESQEIVSIYDHYILECWKSGSEDAFMQLLYFIMSENASVDYQHRDTGISGLMVAAAYGNLPIVKQFVDLGANVMLTSNNNNTACDWAEKGGHVDVVAFLKMCAAQATSNNDQLEEVNNSDMDEHRMHVYNQVVRDELIDYELVLELILHIHTNFRSGSILCFLAGYDDIITVKNIISEEFPRFRKTGVPILIYTLHSNMQTNNQREVFQPAHGKRKIILSTNIAETSITIDDVVYVIDCGKVKEKTFDAATSVCSLRSTWISQACARQRAGRAGRTSDGVCFHMFSRKRFLSFPQYSTPEILRMPLHELCLHTKMLAPTNMSIACFLGLALEPPSPMVTRTAVEELKTLGALNQDESLTPLGLHLVELSVEPHLGKILLYGVLLKCLDPILTIVSSLTHREPFILPAHPAQRNAASAAKLELSDGTYSDHMALLRAFQFWQESITVSYNDKRFCDRFFISSATMETITTFRTQLLGQLRAAGFVRNRQPCDIRDLNINSDNWAVVKAALSAGLYPNIARIDQERFQLRTQREKKVMFHPSSVLRASSCRLLSSQQSQINSNLPSEWVIFDEISRNNQICLIRGITLVTAITILLFTGPIYLPLDCVRYNSFSEDDEDYDDDDDDDDDIEDPFKDYAKMSIDSWLSFLMHESVINDILHLRVKWHAMLLRRMQYPSKFTRFNDENILKCIVEILSIEEEASNFKKPFGIGQRPRPFVPNSNSYSRKPQYSNHNFSSRSWQDNSTGRNMINSTPQSSPKKSSNNPQQKLLQALETNETAINDDYELESNASSLFENINQVIHEASSISNSFVNLSFNNTPNRTSVNLMHASTPKKNFNNSPQYKSSHNSFHNKSLDFEHNGRDVTESDDSTSKVDINHGLRYFVVKVTNLYFLEMSITKKTWIFHSKIEEKFKQLLQDGVRPILIFTVFGSKCFQGIAQLTGGPRILQGIQNYDITWISRADLPFDKIRHLRNQFNNNIRLNKCVDGQEIDPESGADLVQLFTNIGPQEPVQMHSERTPPKNGRAIIRKRYY